MKISGPLPDVYRDSNSYTRTRYDILEPGAVRNDDWRPGGAELWAVLFGSRRRLRFELPSGWYEFENERYREYAPDSIELTAEALAAVWLRRATGGGPPADLPVRARWRSRIGTASPSRLQGRLHMDTVLVRGFERHTLAEVGTAL